MEKYFTFLIMAFFLVSLVGDGTRSRWHKLKNKMLSSPVPTLGYKRVVKKKKKKRPVMIYFGRDSIPFNRNPKIPKEL
jgi:hypothetical protein